MLLEALYQHYHWDFRSYSPPLLQRRIGSLLQSSGLDTVTALQRRVLDDPAVADALLRKLSINVTEMFRNPEFYLDIRHRLLPTLAEQDHIKFWHAGAATGEEAYSMAIMLKESMLYARSTLFVTDFNRAVLEQARSGIYPLKVMQKYTQNYQLADGETSFSDYYHAHHDEVIFDRTLRDNMVFAQHDLTSGQPVSTVDVIFCRNVLIYFEEGLREQVIEMFVDALHSGGFICLGDAETLSHPEMVEFSSQHIYRKGGA